MKIQPTKECRVCKAIFSKPPNIRLSTWSTRQTCSRACGATHKNHNGTYEPIAKVCKYKECRQIFTKPKKDTHEHFTSQEYCSISCSKMGRYNGSANGNWRGEWASYGAIHLWIRRKFGKPEFCEHCKTSERRMYHWANVSGEHKRDRNDWLRLCVPCHKKFYLTHKIKS